MPIALKKKYFFPYQELFQKANKILELNIPMKFDLARNWYFDIHERKFTLYCPPYAKSHEPIFIHYLCHAKMLEQGWPRSEIYYRLTDQAFKENKVKRNVLTQLKIGV